jgi:epsilon-lactone hydrolase
MSQPRSGGQRRLLTPARLRLPSAVVRRSAAQIGRHVLNPALPWEVQRRRLSQVMRPWPVPRGTRVEETSLNGVCAEVVTVGEPSDGLAVVHFHGGGYCTGSPGLARTWAAHLSARAACRVILPDYRLAPEHPYPAAVQDARAAVDAVLGDAAPGAVVVSGDSAGGGLALSVALALRDAAADRPAGQVTGTADRREPPDDRPAGPASRRIAGCILVCPWLDLSADRRAAPELVRRDRLLSPPWLGACAAAYAPEAEWAQPSVSPLLAAHAGLPPLLIQAGTDDVLAPDAERLAASASAAGVDVTYTRWPRMWHDFALQPGLLGAADKAVAQAGWFVQHVTRLPARRPECGDLSQDEKHENNGADYGDNDRPPGRRCPVHERPPSSHAGLRRKIITRSARRISGDQATPLIGTNASLTPRLGAGRPLRAGARPASGGRWPAGRPDTTAGLSGSPRSRSRRAGCGWQRRSSRPRR